MVVPGKLFRSSIGRKSLMAVTGAGLILFLLGHLSGNLLVFAGQDAINSYAEGLRAIPALLWGARIGLIVIFVVHLGLGISLRLENRRARGGDYAYNNTIQASVASRFMLTTGLVIFFYLIYHLAHFTVGWAHSEYFHLEDHLGRHDVYSMVVFSFQQWYITAIYLVAQVFVALHVSHGLPSMFQTLGWNSQRFDRGFRITGRTLAILFFLGYSSIPLAVYLGIVKLP